MRQWLYVFVAAGLVAALGCRSNPPPQKPPPTDTDRTVDSSEEMWEPLTSKDGDEFVVRVVVRVIDTIANAKNQAQHECFRNAVDMATKDYLRDMSKYDANADEINRRILSQPNKYVKRNTILETRQFDNDNKYGMYMRVVIDDQRLKNELQDMGAIRTAIAERKILIVIYGDKTVAKNLINKVGRKLAEYYNRQGYNAILFDEVITTIAEKRNLNDKQTEDFMAKFVEDAEFKGDEEYQGTLTLLREYGRVCVGFNVTKVSVQGRTANAYVEGFAKDMRTGRLFADEGKPASRLMSSDSDRDIAIEDTVYKTAEELSANLVKKTNDWYDKSEQLNKGQEFTFKFTGFTDEEIDLIDQKWNATFSAGGDAYTEGNTYVRTYHGEEKGAELCEKIDMMLKKAGLKAKKPRPDSRATTFEFKKQ